MSTFLDCLLAWIVHMTGFGHNHEPCCTDAVQLPGRQISVHLLLIAVCIVVKLHETVHSQISHFDAILLFQILLEWLNIVIDWVFSIYCVCEASKTQLLKLILVCIIMCDCTISLHRWIMLGTHAREISCYMIEQWCYLLKCSCYIRLIWCLSSYPLLQSNIICMYVS